MQAELNLNIADFDYDLPPDRIAMFPLDNRDHSSLLLYKSQQFSKDYFYNITDHLPEKSLLVLNDSRVIHARLLFPKESGTTIEIFCLTPSDSRIPEVFQQNSPCQWNCLVGNNKRWKSGKLKIENDKAILTVEKIRHTGEDFEVGFSWKPGDLSFGEVLEIFGKVPLPPYIDRNTVESDNTRYQTVFADKDGSVAAPTAGLHFTREMLEELKAKGMNTANLTLHVGAGTFKPVTSKTIAEHDMHHELFSVSKAFIKTIIQQLESNNAIIPVGTTSARSLESLYWMGVKAMLKHDWIHYLDQWEPYELMTTGISAIDAMQAVLNHMEHYHAEVFEATTRMIIVPGYEFKIADGLITNFHQPRSTLLLLVAAMMGEKWKDAYHYALENDFRFLSYGDCCLFMRE